MCAFFIVGKQECEKLVRYH